MAHYEGGEGGVEGELGGYYVGEVGEDEGGGAGETFLRGRVDGTTPATLVEGEHSNGVGGEGGEEGVVAVAVV